MKFIIEQSFYSKFMRKLYFNLNYSFDSKLVRNRITIDLNSKQEQYVQNKGSIPQSVEPF